MSLIYGYEEKGAVGFGEQVEANKESIEDIKEFIGNASSLEGEHIVQNTSHKLHVLLPS